MLLFGPHYPAALVWMPLSTILSGILSKKGHLHGTLFILGMLYGFDAPPERSYQWYAWVLFRGWSYPIPRNWLVNHLQWLATPNNLIFMGVHFIIGKCKQWQRILVFPQSTQFLPAVYANSPLSRTSSLSLTNIELALKILLERQLEHEGEHPKP